MTIGHNSAVRGTFADFKTVKTRGVCQLIIEVPIEAADNALTLLGGVPQAKAEQWVGIAPIAAPKASATPTETEAPKLKGGPICKRAVLLCKNPDFRNWWMGFSAMHTDAERLAKERMWKDFNIESRAELDHNPSAAALFEQLERHYRGSQRGWDTQGASR